MRHRVSTRHLFRSLPIVVVLLAGLPLVFSPGQAAASCGSPNQTGASPQIAHAPTASLQTVTWELAQRHSPLSAADARYIVTASQRATIDDAFALAVWAAETQDGAAPVPGTLNIGNITAAHGVAWAGHIFAVYPTWQAGMAAWFTLINQLYIRGGHATNLLTFALYYVHGLTPDQLTPQQQQEIAGTYVQTLSSIIATLQKHEATIHPRQTNTSGNENTVGASQTLASLLPTTNLPPGWAGPGTRPAAGSIRFASCSTAEAALPPMVLAALQLGVLLRPDAAGIFDHWAANAPAGAISENTITWDTDFIASAYQRATGAAFPSYPPASFWWNGPPGNHPGWLRISAGPGHFPQAGDIAILLDGARGEAALIIGVQLPRDNRPGFALVLQAHAQHVLERWTLQPDGTISPPWPFWTVLQGYLRIPALEPSAAA